MVESPNHLSYHMHNVCAGMNGKGFADSLAAHRQSGNQGRHQQRNHLRPCKLEGTKHLRRNGRRSRTGHNAANVTNHIIADGTDLFRASQKLDCLLSARHFSCRHGMEGLFIGRGNCHADNIKQNTYKDNYQQNDKSHRHRAGGHNFF